MSFGFGGSGGTNTGGFSTDGSPTYVIGDGTNNGDSWFIEAIDSEGGKALDYHMIIDGVDTHISRWNSEGFNAILLGTEITTLALGRAFHIGSMGNKIGFFDLYGEDIHIPAEASLNNSEVYGGQPIVGKVSSDVFGTAFEQEPEAVGTEIIRTSDDGCGWTSSGGSFYALGITMQVAEGTTNEKNILKLAVTYDTEDGIKFFEYDYKGAIPEGELQLWFRDDRVGHISPARNAIGQFSVARITSTDVIGFYTNITTDTELYHKIWAIPYSPDPVATEKMVHNTLLGEELGSLMMGEVEYHVDLPDVASSNGDIYRVLKRTANYWTLGMTSRFVAGYYESDGFTWNLKPNAALPVYKAEDDDETTTNYRHFTPADIASLGGDSGPADSIISPDTLKDLIITDVALTYYDGGENRLLVNSTIAGLISPDGTKMVSVSDAGVFYDGDEVAIASDLHSKSVLVSPDGLKDLIATNTSLTYNDGVRNRLISNATDLRLYSPDGVIYSEVGNEYRITVGSQVRTKVSSTKNQWYSPNSNTWIKLIDGSFEAKINNVNGRLLLNGTYSSIASPDTTRSLLVDNSGAFYDGAEILTVSDAGVSIAELVDGVVPEGQLPSYLDDVINKYLDVGDSKGNGYDAFYDEVELTNKTTEATGIIYIDVTAGGNTSYRWSGTAYTALNSGIVLGETSATAYRGDRGKIAYDHSLESHDYAIVSHVHELIESPDSARNLTLTDSALTYDDETTNRLYISDISSQFASPDGNTQIQVDNDGFYVLDNGIIRIDQTATSSVFKSPDGVQSITIDDTGAYYNGVELLTSGGSGTGDVVGPDESIDYKIPTFDGTTGKLLKQSPVSISGTGVMLGVTSLTVDDVRINDNVVEAIGADKILLLRGTGGMILNDVISITNSGNISGVNELIVDLLKFDGATITTLGTNANLFINPNGTGYVNILANLVVNNKIGIGVSSPAANMHTKGGSEHLRMQGTIAGDGAWQSWYTSGGARRGYFGFGSTNLDIITLNNEAGTDIDIKAGGNKVRLYCNSGTSGLKSPNGSTVWVSDTVSYTPRAWTVGSDRVLKDNITPLSSEAIDFIDGLKPVSYNYKTNIDSTQLGFIAQDVEAVQMSDMVSTDEDGMKGVAYTEIIAPLVAYVQKLEERLTILEAKQ